MSAREYRDAVRDYERVRDVVIDMDKEFDFKILELRQEITEAKKELDAKWRKATDLGKTLRPPFFTKVDDDVVFRLSKDESLKIIPFTEE